MESTPLIAAALALLAALATTIGYIVYKFVMLFITAFFRKPLNSLDDPKYTKRNDIR